MIRRVLLSLLPALMILSACGGKPESEVAAQQPVVSATEPDIAMDVYTADFPTGAVRGVRFDNEPDPAAAVKTDMCLESRLAEMARADGLDTRPDISSVVAYQTYLRQSRHWVSSQVMPEEPDEAALRERYTDSIGRFAVPAQVVFSHVFILADMKDDGSAAKAMEQARMVVDEIAATGNFTAAVRKHSDLPVGDENPGRVGPVALEKLGAEIAAALSVMKPGDVSDPVPTRFGVEVLKLEESTPERTRSFEDVRPALLAEMKSAAIEGGWPALRASLAEKHPVVLNEALLAGEEPWDENAEVANVAGDVYTVREALLLINASHEFDLVGEQLEKLRRGLPAFLESRQVLREMEMSGFFQTETARLREEIVTNRILAEVYVKIFGTDIPVSDAECRAYYDENPDIFRMSDRLTGAYYEWLIPNLQALDRGEAGFRREMLKREITALIEEVKAGRMSREELAAKAGSMETFEDMESGPLGYNADQALFATSEGNFSEPFASRGGMAVGWVTKRVRGDVRPYDAVQPSIERILREERRQVAVEELIDGILEVCDPPEK